MTGFSNRREHAEDVTLFREPEPGTVVAPHVEAFARRYLPILYLSLGNACNQRCIYCSVDFERSLTTPAAELTASLEQAAAAGLRKVSLIGGEPTCYTALTDVVAAARGLGYVDVNLTTNGLRLAQGELLDRLMAAGLTSAQLSLNAVDPVLLDRLADHAGAGSLALRAAEALAMRRALFLFLNFVLLRETLDHLPAYVDQVATWSERRGEPIPIMLLALVPHGRGFANRAALLAPVDQVARAVGQAIERGRAVGVPVLVQGLPACVLRDYEPWRTEPVMRNARLRTDTGEALSAQKALALAKRPACTTCRGEPVCQGVHVTSLMEQGWEGYVPNTDAPAPATAPSGPVGRRAVVVGGTGFLGRRVATLLARRGWHVTSLSRTEPREQRQMPGVTLVHGDRRERGPVAALMAEHPDLWIDLALFSADDATTLTEAWLQSPATHVVGVGSVAEYGALHLLSLPVVESTALAPLDAYGRGKVEAWEHLARFADAHARTLAWAVVPQLWGPDDRQYRDGAIVHTLLRGDPVVLAGSGENRMPDGFVETVATVVVHAATNPGAIRGRFHACGPEVVTPLGFVEIVAETLQRSASCLMAPTALLARLAARHAARVTRVFPSSDVVLARDVLEATGFTSDWSLVDGIRATAYAHRERSCPTSIERLPDALIRALQAHPDCRSVRLG